MEIYLVIDRGGKGHVIPAYSMEQAMEDAGIDTRDPWDHADGYKENLDQYYCSVHLIPTVELKQERSYL